MNAQIASVATYLVRVHQGGGSVKAASQALERAFQRNAMDIRVFRSRALLNMRALNKRTPRENAAMKAYNKKMPLYWPMVEYAWIEYYTPAAKMCHDGKSDTVVQIRSTGVPIFKHQVIDVVMTAVGTWYGYIMGARPGEYSHTQKARGHDPEDKHALRNVDVVFVGVSHSTGTRMELASHEVPRGATLEDVFSFVPTDCRECSVEHSPCMLVTRLSSKSDPDADQADTREFLMDKERSFRFLRMMWNWCSLRTLSTKEDPRLSMFFQRSMPSVRRTESTKRLTSNMVAGMFKHLAVVFGLDPRRYSGRSARSGAATSIGTDECGSLMPTKVLRQDLLRHQSIMSQRAYTFNLGSKTAPLVQDGAGDHVSIESLRALGTNLDRLAATYPGKKPKR